VLVLQSALNRLPLRWRSSPKHRLGGIRRGSIGGAWSVALLLWSATSGAASPSSTIVLTVDESSEAETQAVAAIRAHVSGFPVEVLVVPVEAQRSLELRLAASGALAASRRALGTFSTKVTDDGSLLIFFTEADGEATLVRRLRPSAQGMRVAVEQAAIVVASLIEALLDGGSVGIGRPTRPPANPPPPPADRSLKTEPAASA